MKIENLVDQVQGLNNNISREKIESFVEEKIGLYELEDLEEIEAIEENCADFFDYVMTEAEKWFSSMRQDEQEWQYEQYLIAEFHPSNLN